MTIWPFSRIQKIYALKSYRYDKIMITNLAFRHESFHIYLNFLLSLPPAWKFNYLQQK